MSNKNPFVDLAKAHPAEARDAAKAVMSLVRVERQELPRAVQCAIRGASAVKYGRPEALGRLLGLWFGGEPMTPEQAVMLRYHADDFLYGDPRYT